MEESMNREVTTNDGDAVTSPLVVTYKPGVKMVIAFVAVFALTLAWFFVTADEFVVHLLGVAGFTVIVLFLVESLGTREIILEPDRIVKHRAFGGTTVIPAQWANLTTDQQTIRFYHGTKTNLRERVTIRRALVSRQTADAVIAYAADAYRIRLREEGGEGSAFSGNGAGKDRQVSPLLLSQFNQAVGNQKVMLFVFAALAAVAILIVGLTDDFPGLAPELSLDWYRFGAILLTAGAYFLLRRLNPAAPTADSSPLAPDKLPWSQRFKGVENAASTSAVLATGVAVIGFALFLMGGNLLDFYLFLAVACLYFADFFPRLTTWQQAAGTLREREATPIPRVAVPRRRSLEVSLVLMGALAVTSYGETQHYLYKNKKDCLDDWGGEQNCQEAPAGSTYHRTGYYYGPRYGSTGGRSIRSVGSVSVSRGGFGSMGGIHASFGG